MATIDVDGREIDIITVEAVASLASVNAFGEKHRNVAEDIQNAMAAAVKQAYSEGVVDPVEIKARMLSAREEAKRRIYSPQELQES